MAISPPLMTPRCRLEPFTHSHLTDRYVSWLNDEETMRFSEQRHHHHNLESCRRYMASFEGSPNYFWAIVEVERGLGHIGNINAYVDERNGVGDIGILIGERSAWGRGYGTEAWVRVCEYLLRERNLRKVTGGTLATNKGMLAIMDRAGMQEDGRRRRQAVVDGDEVDMVYVALFRDP
ncbi:MAG: GNAT family N-acetyltransferase [Rhodospirillaceae bacterium]